MKGYPKTRFDIINNTQVQEITTEAKSNPIALYMQPYTSNKGTEDWEVITSFDGFTKEKGGISFIKHGQAQLTVAEALRSGAYVLGKRLVSENATLANVTVKARTVTVDGVTYLYLYAESAVGVKTFEEACTSGIGDYVYGEPHADSGEDGADPVVHDIPLFTVVPMGRGESRLFFRLNPEYSTARNRDNYDFIKYSFEIIEDNETLESIIVTVNPEPIVNGVAQAMNPKIRSNSKQVRVRMHDDGIYDLVNVLAKTATDGESNKIPPASLINYDFLNGYNNMGTEAIGNVVAGSGVAIQESEEPDGPSTDLWEGNMPAEIQDKVCDITNASGIPLTNGTYGTMGSTPMSNAAEMEKMLLEAFGKVELEEDESVDTIPVTSNFKTIIYDLDAYKVDCIFDCNWPTTVKNAVVDLCDYRGDCVFLADLGTTANTSYNILAEANKINKSNFVAIYHNYFNIIDPYTRREITVTMPYLLIPKMTAHISRGVGIPFAGINNSMTFSSIIPGTLNFMPVEIPGVNQKQDFADNNINYISMYDGNYVMETMYVNDSAYTQLSYLHNIMAVQEIIKVIRTRCPYIRYTFIDGEDLEKYLEDVNAIITNYSTHFKSIKCEYMKDEKYEQNNIFYAVLTVQFKNFIQEEYFKIIAIN